MEALDAGCACACGVLCSAFLVVHPTDGQRPGVQGGGGHHSCAGIDNPLPVMSRTQWPVRMQLLYIPLPGSPSAGGNTLSIRVQNTPATFVSTLPESEMRRHAVQQSLLQGWGLFYDMSYIDAVRLPEGIRVKFAVCQTASGGQCLANARMDWPDTSGLSAALRPGLHAYDRTYTQMYVAVEGCNISLTTGGGAGGELHVLVEAENQLPPLHRVGGSVDNHSTGVERCSQFLNNTDYPGHDLTKIDHVASKEACCNLCANNSLCSAGSWDGPASKWASSATCNLKTAAPSSGKTVAPGMWAFVLRSPPPPPACAGLALVPVGLTTWFRANTAAAVSSRRPELESGVNVHTGAGHDAITFTSAGLGQTTVYSTAIADSSLVINNSLTSTSGAAHLIYPLAHGSKIGFYSPADGSAARAKSLAEITTTLAAARAAEQSTYSKYGELAETKTAVQSAVMWQVVFNPLEAGPFAPVIRGNPWGLDKGVVNDDWPYVIFGALPLICVSLLVG